MTSPYNGGYRIGQRLRKTLIASFIAFSIGAGATFYWNAEMFTFLLAPADGLLSPHDGLPVFNSPVDMFGATIGLSMKGGQFLALPVLAVGLLSMLKPLIPSRFWRFLVIFTVLLVGFFLTGVSFVYYVMMPVSLNFLLTFGDDVAVPLILLDKYMELFLSLMLWVGMIFELPVVMYLLSKFRVVSYQRARKVRKYVPFVSLILAALITPSLDGLLTMLVALPMYLLYEVGLFTAWIAHPEEGNYLWFKTIDRWIGKVRDGVVWVVRRPVVVIRWLRRKVREYGSGWWWD